MQVMMTPYFSSYHLWGARHASRLAKERETSVQRPTFDIAHRAYVMTAILSAAAFLEAGVNELFQNAYHGHLANIEGLGSGIIEGLSNYWAKTEVKGRFKPILKKYQEALRISGKEPFLEDVNPYEDAGLVIKLRNEITHFKPTTVILGEHSGHGLEDNLKDKFEWNHLMDGSRNHFIWDKCLGAGCAEWTVGTVKAFADKFHRKLGLKPNYQSVDFDLV